MKVVSIGNCKGGVGKTALVYNLASLIAQKKKKVLILDVDPQSNATSRCRISNIKNEYECMVDIFEKGISPSRVVIEKPISELPYLDLFPSSMALTGTEMLMVNRTAREFILKQYFEKHIEFFNKYDYIFCDMAPNLNLLNQNVLAISDVILLASSVSIDAIFGATYFMEMWSGMCKALNLEYKIKGIIINNFDKRVKLSRQFTEFVQGAEELDGLIFDAVIPTNAQMQKTETERIPLCILDNKCPSFIELQKLYKELLKKGIL